MRIVFMGNPEFAIPTLQSLIDSHHNIVCVVSNPPKPMGRHRKLGYTAVGQFSRDQGLPLLESESLNSELFQKQLKEFKPDVFVVVAFRILPKSLIDLPERGSINLHASLLPKYRGPAPIQWSLMNGERKTGITVFQIAPKVDTGDILLQRELPIKPEDDYCSLGTRLSKEGADLVLKALSNLETAPSSSIQQNSSLASFAPKITKEMEIIDWSWPGYKIHNWIRGLSPKPGMSTMLVGKKFWIYKTKPISNEIGLPGEIIKLDNNVLWIATGDGALSILEVQLEGKRKMKIDDFLRGTTLRQGAFFGT